MNELDRRRFLHSASGLVAAAAIVPDAALFPAPYRPKEPLTLAVLGAGKQGREILGELAKLENVRVAAVVEPDGTRLSRALRRTKDAKGYPTAAEAFTKDPGIQAVVIATPTHLHREHFEAALAAGKHAYVEAPMAGSIADAKAMAKAAASAPTVVQVGHPARTNPVYKLARSFYRSDSIQTLVGLRAQWRQKTSWRDPVSDPKDERTKNWRLYRDTSLGLPGEIGSHQLDTLTWFTGKKPVAVEARSALLLHEDGREIPDTVHATFHFEGGIELAWEATLANSFEGSYELFVGTMGAIKMADGFGWLFKEADAPIQGWEVYASRQQFHKEEGITLIADATKLASQGKLKDGIGLPNPPLFYALEAFVKSIAEKAPPACTATDGLAMVAVAAKAHEAAMKQGSEAIPAELFKAE